MIVAVVRGPLVGYKELKDFSILEAKRIDQILGYNVMAILQISEEDNEKVILQTMTRVRARFHPFLSDAGIIVSDRSWTIGRSELT